MDDKQVFDRIARELSSGRMESGLWAAVLAECGDDPQRAKTLYVRRRHDQLTGRAAEAPQAAADDEMVALRRELVDRLARSGKGSLYGALGVPASMPDTELAAAIAAVQRGGGERTAEMRYAIETLGKPSRRVEYDRRLLEQLAVVDGTSPAAGDVAAFAAIAEDAPRGFRWLTHGLVAAVVLVGGGYITSRLADDGRAAHEAAVAQREADAGRAAEAAMKHSERVRIERLRQQAEFDKRETERLAREKAAEENRATERLELERDVLKERRLAEEKLARQARAKAQAEMDAVLAAEEAERQVVEKAKRDRAYWSCMNKALDDTDPAGAKAKCGGLRDGSNPPR